MLSKRICKQCALNYWPDLLLMEGLTGISWSFRDDQAWDEGIVWCPRILKEGDNMQFIKKPPHRNCPYQLEHLMERE